VHGDALKKYIEGVREDVRFIRRIVETYDPNFSWSEAARARARHVLSMEYSQRATSLHEAARHVSSLEARGLIDELIDERVDDEIQDQAASPIGELTRMVHPENFGMEKDDRLSPELFGEAQQIVDQVLDIQRTEERRTASYLAPLDVPAYHALVHLCETLNRSVLARDSDTQQLRNLILEYARLAPQTSPAHVDAARRQAMINFGRRGFSRDLVKRVDDLLSRVRAG